MSQADNLLIVADSEHDANMLYATRMFVPDPFIYFRTGRRSYVVMSDLEIDRAKKQAQGCSVLSLSQYQRQARENGVKNPGFADVLPLVLREKGIRGVTVPQNFPLGLALDLQRKGIRVKPKPGQFFPERELKTPDEVKHISASLRVTEEGLRAGLAVLRAAKIGKGGRLMYEGKPLTSERLRAAIDTTITGLNGLASHTIVAGGEQACDPHESGHGPLRAHEPIILDIFPRSQATGYFGDMTRTVVKGRASETIRKLYDTVLRGQALAFKKMRAGVLTKEVHQTVQDFFVSQGYQTGRHQGRMQGFFHGTGHGLGLEIHEPPRTGPSSVGELKAGMVVTVEPGLYYPGLGGVRIEDVALVTDGAPRNLTRFEKVLEIA